MYRKCLVAVAALLAAVALVACGGSSGGSSGGTGETAVTTANAEGPDAVGKAQWVKEANLICKRSSVKREARLAATKGKPPTNDKAELEQLVLKAFVPSLEEMMKELSALKAPSGEEQQIQAILAAFEEGIESRKAKPGNALSEAAFERAEHLSKSYGLTECEHIG
jgi:hypothetical protein